ncbi:MAG: InlB B-repeat-containing protein [Blautia sp.]|nr:InlB B-repeat-containing protein [Lachnoclostridium sp.]MCM1212514.1 InlB B-repeat-containing protein [Blautia sp.]
MRKRFFTRKMAVCLLAVGILGLTACGTNQDAAGDVQSVGTEDVQDTQPEDAQQMEGEAEPAVEPAGKHVVTFLDDDGTTVLDTVEVEDGALAESYVPEKEGYTFAGWFATPNKSHRFDFSAAITDDTSIFAGFVSYVEDTREYAILGSGKSPVLMESNWGKVIEEQHMMAKEENADANVYTITLDLETGDEFQFAINSSWENQRGYGYLSSIELDGVEYFANSGGLGDTSVKRSNIKVSVAGNYTFTLTTYPGEDFYDEGAANYSEANKECFNVNPYDTIEWTYNGESSTGSVDMQTDYYIKGAKITGWEDVYSEETKFSEQDGIYTLTVALEEGDEFMFTSMVTAGDVESVGNEYIRFTNIAEDDTDSLSHVTGMENANLVAAESGTYVFTYDPATQILTVDVK